MKFRTVRIVALLIWTFVLVGSGFIPDAQAAPVGLKFGGQVEHFESVPWSDLARAGMTWVKIQAFTGDESKVAGFIAEAHRRGLKTLISAEGSRSAPLQNLASYTAFLKTITQAGADAVEIWNEPNNRLEFAGSAADYLTVYRAARGAIKAVNPGALVILGAAMPTLVNNYQVIGESIWDRAIRDGIPNGSDCVGVHYEDFPLTGIQERFNQVASLWPGQAICYTELGVLSGEGYGPVPANFYWAANMTAQGQAKVLHKMLDHLPQQVQMVIVFNVGFTAWGDDPQAGYGIIRPGGTCPFCH